MFSGLVVTVGAVDARCAVVLDVVKVSAQCRVLGP